MKKIFTLLAAALSAAATVSAADVWSMPGSYNGWSLENNILTEADGKFTLHLDKLEGEFKFVKYDFDGAHNWDNEWGGNGSPITPGTAYVATFKGSNLSIAGKSPILEDVTVTLTPGDNSLSVLIQAVRVIEQGDLWYLVGDAPLNWDMPTTNMFTKGEGNVYTFSLTGEITQTFKFVKNGSWANSYTTEGTIELNKDYTVAAPKDPADNMSPAEGPWVNPVFTLIDNGDAGITFKVTASGAGVEAVEADDANAPVLYYNLQGQRVANPDKGLYIRVQGEKATKVAL